MQNRLDRLVSEQRYGVPLKVGSEPLGCNQQGVSQFFQFSIPGLGVSQRTTDVVDRPLDFCFFFDKDCCESHGRDRQV